MVRSEAIRIQASQRTVHGQKIMDFEGAGLTAMSREYKKGKKARVGIPRDLIC